MIRNNPTLCFDTFGHTHNGAGVILYHCNYGVNQLFRMDSQGYIRMKHNQNKIIEAGGTVSQNLKVWDYAGKSWQRWERTSDGQIRSMHHRNKYLGVLGGCNGVKAWGSCSGSCAHIQPKGLITKESECPLQQKWIFFNPGSFLCAQSQQWVAY